MANFWTHPPSPVLCMNGPLHMIHYIYIISNPIQTCTIWAVGLDDTRSTTVTIIIVADCSIGHIIAITISNKRMNPSQTGLIMVASTNNTMFCVDVITTAVTTIILVLSIIGFIVAKAITNQCVVYVDWKFRNTVDCTLLIGHDSIEIVTSLLGLRIAYLPQLLVSQQYDIFDQSILWIFSIRQCIYWTAVSFHSMRHPIDTTGVRFE